MGNKLNGIVLNGKFYRALPMHLADMFELQVNGVLIYTKVSLRTINGEIIEDVRRYRFRYSQELTDKLKGNKE